VNQIGPQREFIEAAPIIRAEDPIAAAATETGLNEERARRTSERTAILQRNFSRIHRATWILSGMSMLLLTLAVALMVMSIQISRALSESRRIAAQLEQLGQFEDRILSRLDTFNAGVQSLIGKTNDAIYNIRGEVEQTAKTVRDASAEIKTTADQMQLRMTGTAWQTDGESPPGPVRRSVQRPPDTATADQAPPAALPTALATPSMPFRRIVNPDGSTTYQKVR
jgi:hypothetical protein